MGRDERARRWSVAGFWTARAEVNYLCSDSFTAAAYLYHEPRMRQTIAAHRVALIMVCASVLALLNPHAAYAQLSVAQLHVQAPTANRANAEVGPTLASLPVAVQASLPTASASPPNATTRQNQAIMIVGGAAVLVGIIIGGDTGTVFVVGGAIAGLYGLYRYLQ